MQASLSRDSILSALVVSLFVLSVTGLADSASAKEQSFVGGGSSVSNIIATTTEGFEGRKIHQYLGIVRGVSVRQPTIGQTMKANFKGIVGGKMTPLISMCEEARETAFNIVLQKAQSMGANAVVGVRYDSSAFGDSSDMGTEVVCYGTAVIVDSAKDEPTKQACMPDSPNVAR